MKMKKNPTKKDFLNDLYLFYRLFIASNYVNSVPAPHIKKLSRKLMDLRNGTGKHRLAVSMPPRHKLADSTPILTYNKGWTTHGDLEIGDYVFGLNGEPTKIIGVSEKEICDRLITFTNGSKILAHEGHLWSVYRRGNDKLQVVSTKDMEDNFSYVEKNDKKRYRFQLPLMSPIQYAEKELPIDPYWLGYWLGDGTYNKPCITHDKEDGYFIDVVPYEVSSQSIHKDTGVYTTYFSKDNLINKLKNLNLFKNKHIPQLYKESSFEQRLHLLAGLIDSDGSVDAQGRVRFINTNKKLIDDVFELCMGLGLYPYRMTPYKASKINEYKKNSKSLFIHSNKDCYHIGFQPRFSIPTTIPRKKITEKGLRRRLSITNIEKVDEGELGKCIEVDAEDGIYLAGNELIPTHNSKSSMVTLAFPLWLLFQNPNTNILIVTGSPKLSDKFGIQLREYIRNLGPYFNVYLSDVKQASTHLMFCDRNKKLYRGNILLASSGGGITGQDADYLILDDPYRGNDDEFTPGALQKKIDWANRVVEQRIEPHTKYCILHTRWHPIAKNTPVLTPNGWTTHGELKKGDYVFHPSGKPIKINKVHPTVMVDNCFEFANDDSIISGNHHLWNVYDWSNRKQRLMETHEIMERKTLVGKNNRSNFLVDSNESLHYPEQEVPIDPYWLGLWLGDGHHKRPSICIQKDDAKYVCESLKYDVIRYDEGIGDSYEVFYTHQGLLDKLKKLNVYGNKHIPDIYLHNSYDVRMKLLAGLIDSDGSVEKSSNRVVFVNTNKLLLNQTHELMTGLGFNVKVEKRPYEKLNEWKRKSSYNSIISKKDVYALRITPHISIPTKIPRKKIDGNGVNKRIGLIDKYKVEPVEGNCITVDVDDGMYLVGKNLTPTHNSNDLIGYYNRVDPDSYDFIEFPALDENNEPLWKERYTTEELLKKKEVVGERVFQSVYQQKPIDATSDFFNMKHLKFGLPKGFDEQSVCRAWDIASSDALTNNDFTAGAKIQRYDDYCIISDLVHGRFGGNTKRIIQQTAQKDTPNVHIIVETGVAAAGKLLYEEWCNQLKGFIVEQAKVSGGGSKVDRATPLQNAIEDGKVYIDIEDPVLRQVMIDELSTFPNGEHDDITDAIAHGYNYLFVNEDITKKTTAKMGVVFL